MNPFYNPADCEFEVVGYFEELIDPETTKLLGVRTVAEPTRPIGSPGRLEYKLVQDTVLRKGVKTVVVKASPAKPVRVVGMLQVLCGRTKFNPQPPKP